MIISLCMGTIQSLVNFNVRRILDFNIIIKHFGKYEITVLQFIWLSCYYLIATIGIYYFKEIISNNNDSAVIYLKICLISNLYRFVIAFFKFVIYYFEIYLAYERIDPHDMSYNFATIHS